MRIRLEAFVLGSMLMGLSGGLYAGFIGYISPFDFQPVVTFQIWTMLILGGSANNRGALLGAVTVWGIWTSSGYAISKLVPPAFQAQSGALTSDPHRPPAGPHPALPPQGPDRRGGACIEARAFAVTARPW